jgi:hypothetical protein
MANDAAPDPPPASSLEVNSSNILSRIRECETYMAVQQWGQFQALYEALAAYQKEVSGAGLRLFEPSSEISQAWNVLRANAADRIMRKIDGARSYPEFLDWAQCLSKIVADPRCLWNLLHTEVQPALKVMLEQSLAFAGQFFTPVMLFDYGIDSFLASSLCDLSDRTDEESVIDVFYALAGYVRACRLDSAYHISTASFLDFVRQLLLAFLRVRDFDAHRFVWLVEVIGEHLQLAQPAFLEICRDVLVEYADVPTIAHPIAYLQDICVISTSPALQLLPILNDVVTRVFARALSAQLEFLHRYIFGCFVQNRWDDEATGRVSDAVVAWRLYIQTVVRRVSEMPELPATVTGALIDESLSFFQTYYGAMRPSRARAAGSRRPRRRRRSPQPRPPAP